MQEDLIKHLIEAGLDDKEAQIYLAILHFGQGHDCGCGQKIGKR